ncbi:restriction endonuclease subunit S [Aestuariivivens sp. NBU2969]|uniref:restriction endonuclease subunit S n=1 Tax=Aestuariivivens sp. NBU2969 TaxID=2873267 RepID=UPI001CBE73D4|nr:restriction endonuclease subunit S [Aestuariivivens sp. NBU2969]
MNETLKIHAEELGTKIGFKKTKIGWIPEDWDVKSLRDCAEILDNRRKPLNSEERKLRKGDIPYYGANGVVDYIDGYLFEEDLILIAEDGGYFDEFLDRPIAYRVKGKSWVNNHAHVIRVRQNFSYDFIFYCLQHKNILKYLNGGTRAKLNKGELVKLPIQIPSFLEQQKIAFILSIWDETIRLKKELLNSNILLRKSLEQNLLSGKIRLKKFVECNEKVKTKIGDLPKDWELKPLSEVLIRVKERLVPISTENYRQIGIRSHCKGIFYKEEVSGQSLGNKSVYWIQQDCFIVNIVFAWEHAIAKTTINEVGMIASHRFPMYKPNESLELDFLLYFFKTAMGKHLLGLASPGGAGRNKTLGQTEFIKLKMPIPSLDEQKNIISILNTSDNKIELLKREIRALEEQKKGLMQQLLTGKIRVKV